MITTFIKKDGKLVDLHDRAWNPEIETAVYKSEPDNFELKFKAGCVPIYEKTQRYTVLTAKFDNEIIDHINDAGGRMTSKDDDFDRVMKDEGLQSILGAARVIKIVYEIKNLTNGMDCDPCVC